MAIDDTITKRLESVGKICVQGKKCEGVDAVAAAADGDGTRSSEDIVGEACNTCYGTGLPDAPKVGDKAEWDKRVKKQGSLDGLLVRAISGINVMSSKGIRIDYPDDELKVTTKHTSGL